MQHAWLLPFFMSMFEKFTKKFASKATDNAVEGVKQTLNDRFNKYGDILVAGLAIGVIAVGSHHLMRQSRRNQMMQQTYLPYTGYSGQPVIVNNYYREREEYSHEQRGNYSKRNAYIQNGRLVQGAPQKANRKR